MVDFIFFFEAAQDENTFLNRWFINKYRLKPPRERRVFFNIFAIFIKRCRANTTKLTTCQRRFQQIGRIHRPIGFSRPNKLMHLVNEQDDFTIPPLYFFQNGFQTFFKFTAIFCPGDKRAHIKR